MATHLSRRRWPPFPISSKGDQHQCKRRGAPTFLGVETTHLSGNRWPPANLEGDCHLPHCILKDIGTNLKGDGHPLIWEQMDTLQSRRGWPPSPLHFKGENQSKRRLSPIHLGGDCHFCKGESFICWKESLYFWKGSPFILNRNFFLQEIFYLF